MCGRYVINSPTSKTKKLVKSAINIKEEDNYNAHPYQNLPIIKRYKNGNTLENLKWGIIPSWAKKRDFRPLINARLETIDEKVSFKKLIKLNRCIAVADGFYEWRRDKNNKIPHYIFRKDKKNLFFAGIYNDKEFCLITENASLNLEKIHHRQPVILNEDEINNYLDLENNGTIFLKNRNTINLNFYQISNSVNKTSNNNVSLIQKI